MTWRDLLPTLEWHDLEPLDALTTFGLSPHFLWRGLTLSWLGLGLMFYVEQRPVA